WVDRTVQTDGSGHATVMIPHPTDGLASTYGVRIEAGGASAVTRILVPTSRATIRLQLDRDQQTLRTPVNFDVYANEVGSGKPLPGARVTVQMQHGTSIAQQELTLDQAGHAHGTFSSPSLGTNLIFASLVDGGRKATDAGQVDIVPQATQDTSLTGSSNIRIALDRTVYHVGEEAHIDALLPGARGDALLTIESANGARTIVAPVRDGRAAASVRITDETGDVRVGAAFVRDGSIAWSTVPLTLDAAGRPMSAAVVMPDAPPEPGTMIHVALRGVANGEGTAFVRISRGAPSGGALFESAPALLAVGLAATQVTAPDGRTWHPWVDSTGVHAQVIGFERRSSPPQNLSLEQADTEAISWTVLHDDGSTMTLQVPLTRGRYTLSILKVDDDGRVISASSPIVVQ
ncbi:MAG TPA: hypothetical protein VIK27_11355, partial [Candidatus Aquilonibacter sp.]